MNIKKKWKRIALNLVVILILVFSTLYANARKESLWESYISVKYSDFLVELEAGKVADACIYEDEGYVLYHLSENEISYYTGYPESEDFNEKLLLNGVEVTKHKTNGFLRTFFRVSVVLYLIGLIIQICVWIYSRNEDKVESRTPTKVSFADVAGLEEIKEDLLFIAEIAKKKNNRVPIPKGILFEGPPGNGKTLLAKALADESDMLFLAANSTDFLDKYYGESENKFRKIFQKAKKRAPCILFIDEIDAVGSKRSTEENSGMAQAKNTLLNCILGEMDGIDGNDGVVVIAATNLADALDDALVRPGRFDRTFHIGNPDRNARKQLFDLYAEKDTLADGCDLSSVFPKTAGMSCAEIKNIVDGARFIAAKDHREKPGTEDFEISLLQQHIRGNVRKDGHLSEKAKKISAYHEAGHTVVAHFCAGRTVTKVSIQATTSGAGGFTQTLSNDEDFSEAGELKGQIAMLVAGRIAEQCLSGSADGISSGAAQDVQKATAVALRYLDSFGHMDYTFFGEVGAARLLDASEELILEAEAIAKKCIEEHWKDVCTVAEALLEKTVLTKEAVSGFLA